jgi:hypothetical protein
VTVIFASDRNVKLAIQKIKNFGSLKENRFVIVLDTAKIMQYLTIT